MINKILAIAVNSYDDIRYDNLSNCLNDVNQVTNILKTKYIFDDIELLTTKKETTRSFIYNKLNEYFINCLDDEVVLLIYIGHGEYNETLKTTYWIPSDATYDDSSTWFNLNDLLTFLKASKALHIGIISDSCFSGAIFEQHRGGGFEAFETKKSRLALTSGSKEKVSDGHPNSLSPFAKELCDVLSDNTNPKFLFTKLSENLILKFNRDRLQTPMFGSLNNIGHEGGSLVLYLKESEDLLYEDISIPLNIDLPFVYDYECKIPFFKKNPNFDSQFVNSYIQSSVYSFLSEVRLMFTEKYFVENEVFYYNINYTIDTLNEKLLSMVIAVENHLGGVHPNNYLTTLNIAFKPERKLSLYDVIEYNSFNNFISDSIKRYSCDEEQIEILDSYKECATDFNIDFTIDEEKLNIFFYKFMPRAVQALGDLSIPLDDLKLKI